MMKARVVRESTMGMRAEFMGKQKLWVIIGYQLVERRLLTHKRETFCLGDKRVSWQLKADPGVQGLPVTQFYLSYIRKRDKITNIKPLETLPDSWGRSKLVKGPEENELDMQFLKREYTNGQKL